MRLKPNDKNTEWGGENRMLKKTLVLKIQKRKSIRHKKLSCLDSSYWSNIEIDFSTLYTV